MYFPCHLLFLSSEVVQTRYLVVYILLALANHTAAHTVIEDRESCLWVLIWITLRYSKMELSDDDDAGEMLKAFDDVYVGESSTKGGQGKKRLFWRIWRVRLGLVKWLVWPQAFFRSFAAATTIHPATILLLSSHLWGRVHQISGMDCRYSERRACIDAREVWEWPFLIVAVRSAVHAL